MRFPAQLKIKVIKSPVRHPVITQPIRSKAMCQVLFCCCSCITTITNAASAERIAMPGFKSIPVTIVRITAAQMKNKLGWCIRNISNPVDEPRTLAFILSKASLLESFPSGAITNTTETILQKNWCCGKHRYKV